MKILLLNGSSNKNGNTFTTLSEIAKQLEKNGVESEIMQLGNKPVRGCIACGQCRAKQLGHCIFDDDVCNRIVEKLNEADALIVGSPVYYGQPNGAVMAVLQRAFFSGANVQNKPAASVAICRRRCYGCLSDAEYDIRDYEHACSVIAILEHSLRHGSR